MTTLVFYSAVGFTIFCIVALMMAPVFMRPTAEVQRIQQLINTQRPERRQVSSQERFEEQLFWVIGALRAKLGLTVSEKSRERLEAAGIRSKSAPDIFFATQCLTPLAGIFAGSFVDENKLFWMLALAAVGYLIPGIWITEAIRRRRDKIRRSLPDAIDLMVICVEAGLGMDQALLRIGEELVISHPEIQEELNRVHLEQRAGRLRLEAWQNLATRTKIEEIAVFTGMLVQTDRFGTPISKALSGFAEELRLARRQKAEEAAAKTKIKIIFPLVFFIFPCMFIVLLAPAFLNILSNGIGGTAQ